MSNEPAEPAEPDDEEEPSSEELVVPAGYIVRDEAIKQLGSKATVERKVASQQLRSTLVPRDGRKPVRVYLAEDVETLLRQKQQRREAQPPSVRAAAETSLVPKVPSSPNGVPAPFFTELVNVVREIAIAQQELRERIGQLQLPAPQEQQQPQVPLETKLWLSLEEARAYSGLTKKDLLGLMHDDILTFRPVMRKRGVPLRILRASLDSFQG